MIRQTRGHHLDQFQTRAFDDARYAIAQLRRSGLRQEHGIGENIRLTPAELRDLDVIERAINRLFDADRKRRGR